MRRNFHYFFSVLLLFVFSTATMACGDDGNDDLYGESKKEEKETVAPPVIDVQGGLYTESPEIEISCETEDAVIRYTLNNSEPNEASSKYSGPITLESNKTTTLKAKAFKEDFAESSTVTEKYTITGIVSAPVFTLTPGSYTEKQTLKILSDTQEAVVKYTTDGSEPSRHNGTIYSVESMDITKTTTLKAIAYVENWQESSDSNITSETYEITGQVEPLSITPSGNYTSEIPVEITSNTPDIEIRYTLADSDPSRTSGTLYKGPFTLKEDSKIKAMGYRLDWEESSDSEIVSAEYVITGHVDKPRLSVDPGIYTDTKTVSIACETSDSKIRFTTDGSEPTRTNGYTYTEKITISTTTTLKAMAYVEDWQESSDSEIISGTYTITGKVKTPTIIMTEGETPLEAVVTINSETEDTDIRYTTNGTTPSRINGKTYTEPFNLTATTTVKAMAYNPIWEQSSDSDVVQETFTTGDVLTPHFSPPEGSYTSDAVVEIASGTPDTVIRYTTNESKPSRSNGTEYTGPLMISSTTTLKAMAYRPDWNSSTDSEIITGHYNITGKVSTPVISPSGGNFTNSREITISTSTSDAEIRYTLNGNTPSRTNGLLYTGKITLDSSATVKAIAYRTDWEESSDSNIVSEDYNITGNVSNPVITPGEGNYTEDVTISMSVETPETVIKYTTDGSAPSRTNGITYTSEFTITDSTTIKAIAYKSDWQQTSDSDVITKEYTITGNVAVPRFGSSPGNYTDTQNISLSCETNNTKIRYTIDKTEPTRTNGYLYTDPITVSSTTTIKAIAYREDWQESSDSPIISGEYVITGSVITPIITFSEGSSPLEIIVQISSDTEGAVIRYTTNGSTPSRTNGIKYNTPFTLNASTVVKAMAYKTDWQSSADSDIAEKSYETGRVHTPVMNPPGGYYTDTENIEITTSTAESTIMYTLDNTTPSRSNGIEYSGPVPVSSDAEIKAMAYRKDWESSTDSMIAEASYTITGSVKDPIISPSPGNYTDAQDIVITTETSGAEIRYTLNGEPPTRTNGFLYTGSVNVDSSATVKAIAYKTDWEESSDSNVVTSEFTITGNVRNPEISPSGGFFTDNASISISSATENAVIKYTTDGSTPSRTNGIAYSSEFLIEETSTVKAIAYRTDWQESSDSDIIQGIYTITGKVVPPVFGKESGNYTDTITTSITSETDGATIRYTTDGSSPSRTHGYLYTGSISVSSTTDIKAIAYKEDWQESSDSNTSSASYTITGKVITPVINMVEGSGPDEIDVTISTETSGATIRYTTNNTDPSRTNGTLYSGTFTLSSTTTIKAIAYKEDWQESSDSDIAQAEYDTGKVLTPNFSPQGGYYTDTTAVEITTGTDGAIIRYTTDESTPSRTNGLTYTGAFDVSSPTTIKTMAYKDGWAESTDSDVATATYTITGPVADPIIDPFEGYFTSSASVSITCSTSEANIRYTTDGSTPSRSNGLLYSGPFTISSTTIVKAIAYKDEWQESSNSTITEADINITGAASAPQFTPAAGNYTEAQNIFISSGTPGAVITYTTDNTLPTRSSNSYDEGTGVFINADTTLRALAYIPEWEESSDSTSASEYTITGSVSPPEISPEEGTYEESVSITLESSNPDAIIRYTTDNSDPDRNNGTIYTDSFTLYSTKTIKAFAYVETWETSSDSPTISRTFEITGTVAAPTFSPEPLPENEVTADPVYVRLNVETSDAEIRYTTDSTTPTSENGTVFNYNDSSEHIAITEPTTIMAIAYKDNWTDSPVITKTYSMKVATPTYTPGVGTYNDAVSVTLNVGTPEANMKYTTDGSEPSEGNGTLYEGSFEFSSGGNPLKVIAYREGWASSYVNILYDFKVAVPEFSVSSGIYNTQQTQTVSTSTSQATIRFSYNADTELIKNCNPFSDYANTCEEKDAICSGPDNETGYDVLRFCDNEDKENCVGDILVYNSESDSVDLTIKESKTTRAIACRSTFEESAVATNSIELKAAKPVIGDISEDSVSIEHRYTEADIKYSTDSQSPSSPYPQEGITVNKPTIIKAITTKEGWTNSDMTSKLIEPDTYTYSSIETYDTTDGTINDVITDTAENCSDLCIVKIPSGTYNQDILISTSDKVSIRGAAGNKPTINGKVTFPGGLTEITFIENLNIVGTGDGNTTTAVSIQSGSSPTIRNCTINGGNTDTDESRAIFSTGSTPLIYNNNINGGSGNDAIAVKNEGTGRLFMNNNNIYGGDNYSSTENTEFYGLYNENVTGDVLLHNNTITTGNSNNAYGIYNDNSNNIEIFGNHIEGCTECDNFYGIFNTETSEKIFIVNNIIKGTESAENSYNIYNKSPHIIISNNTILIRGPVDYDTVGIYNFMSSGYTGKLNIALKNNIISDETDSSSYCLYEKNTASNFSKVSNNNLYGCNVLMRDDGTVDINTITEINNTYKGNKSINPQLDINYMSSQTDLIFGLNLVNDYYFPTNELFNPIDKNYEERETNQDIDWMTGAYNLQ